MRIAHATDIHFTEDVPLLRLSPKRVLGTANQYLRGRRHHFPRPVQRALAEHLVALAPDVLVITGDLTAQALQREFEIARDVLRPALAQQPTLVIPGNHDVYTGGAKRASRMASYFGEWMHLTDGGIARLDVGPLTVLGLDPNRPTWLTASGEVPAAQLDALAATLADPALADRAVILALHYPILDRHGAIYDGAAHGLRNASALIDVLKHAPKRPIAILHGHEHHGFTVPLKLGDVEVPIYDCGSSGYAFNAASDRAACMNEYEINDGSLTAIRRYRHNGEAFTPEAGGAYATGR